MTAKSTRFVRDDVYEEMGSSYQCLQVATLDEVLRENGVGDASVRQKICESYLFSMGIFHDQGWFKASADGERVYPLLCFSTHFLNLDTPIGDLGLVYAPSESFSYQEYALANASLLFDGDPKAQVETGIFAEESDDV